MVLSWENYLDCLNHFLTVSASVNDGWQMIDKSDSELEKLPENCYLMKKVVESCATSYSEKDKPLSFEENIEQDTSSLQSSSKQGFETLVWEYHILYSTSYSVPVLYFNVRNTAGKLLPLGDVWNILNVSKEELKDKWSFVSQQEHPILLRPYFYLHPCKSFELFKVCENSSVNPFVTWLSSIAHIVHLNVALEYGNHPFKKCSSLCPSSF